MDTGDHEIEVPLRSGAPSGADGTGATDPLALLNIVGLDELSKPVPPMTFVVDQLLPSDSVVVVAGPAGAQKSWLALEACVSVGAGDSCMGRFRSELGFALYMNFEAGRHAVRRRFHKLVAARGYWPPNILFAELPDAGPADPSFLTALKAVMDRYQPKLVAVDTYRASMPGIDEND
ncbi:MAG: AAA family ATPase, partial [Polyangiaceae bacterium]